MFCNFLSNKINLSKTKIFLISILILSPKISLAQNFQASAIRGAQIYNRQCSACHSVNENRIGPMHNNVYGRKAGGVKNYEYSKALSSSKIIWNDQTLNTWLSGPTKMVPNTKMGIAIISPKDREDVIAYLKTLKSH